jgi:TIR domain/NACHT domain
MASAPYIFISYKSQDQRFALQLAADLQNRGVRIWLDKLNIQVAHLWGQEIDHALKSSSGVIVVMTPQYFQSQICQDELHYAYTNNLPIFPIMLRRVETSELPFWLPARQHLNFTNWRSSTYATVLDQLVTRIRTLQKNVISTPPDAESKYLNSLIAELETYQGVEEYVQLGGQASRVSSSYGKRIAPGLSRLANLDTLDKETLESIEQAKEKHPRFVLIGDPGSGKSTTLRHLALESARKRQADSMQPLPVYLLLALWVNEKTPDDFIRAYIERAGLGSDVLATTQMELYLDGLNEIGSASELRAGQLRQWLKANKKTATVIISCRKANYVKALDLGIPIVVCEELDDNRIKQFAENYLEANSEEFLSLLDQSATLQSDEKNNLIACFCCSPGIPIC